MTFPMKPCHERKRSFSRGRITQWQPQKVEKLPPAATYKRSGEQGCLKKSKVKMVCLQASNSNQQSVLCLVQGIWESLWEGAHNWASICPGFLHRESQCPHVGESGGLWALGHHSWHPGPELHSRFLRGHIQGWHFSLLPYRAGTSHLLCHQPEFWPSRCVALFYNVSEVEGWLWGSCKISGGITALVSKLWRRDGFCQAAHGDHCVSKRTGAISCRKSLLQRNCTHQKPHAPSPARTSAWCIARALVSCTWGHVTITQLSEGRQRGPTRFHLAERSRL